VNPTAIGISSPKHFFTNVSAAALTDAAISGKDAPRIISCTLGNICTSTCVLNTAYKVNTKKVRRRRNACPFVFCHQRLNGVALLSGIPQGRLNKPVQKF
jgi:hypothetical protein